MAVRCEILFVNNPMYTGQYLEGTVRLELLNETNFRRIKLKFFGSEKIETDDFKAMQKCADYEREIIGETQLQPGTHEFPFKFWYLRSQFPSSFEGEFGEIQYFVSALVEIPSQPVEEFKEKITIINSIDINTPEFQSSLSKTKKLKFNFFFLTWSTLNIEVGIKQKACTSGSNLTWDLKVKSPTPKDYNIRLELVKVVTYGSGGKTVEILTEQSIPKFLASSCIRVPNTSGDINGSLIKIRHFIRATAVGKTTLVKYQTKHICDLPIIIVNSK